MIMMMRCARLPEIDGLSVHFIHVRSKAPNAIPLILSHGWPGSVLECTKVIPLLTGNELGPNCLGHLSCC
jgi:hypothetical protein